MAYYCGRCGGELVEGNAYCPNCGAAQNWGQPPVVQYQPIMQEKKGTPGLGFAITSMILGFVGLMYSSVMTLVLLLIHDVFSYGYRAEGMAFAMSFSTVIYAAPAVIAVCFAAASKKRGYNGGMRKTGLITGWVSIGLCGLCILLSFAAFA